MEQDRDYDGEIDTWHGYEDGKLAQRDLDTNQDGKPDVWERYRERSDDLSRRSTATHGRDAATPSTPTRAKTS